MRTLALVPLSFLLCSCTEIRENINQIKFVRVSDVQAVHVHPLKDDNGLQVISVSSPVINEVLKPRSVERLITVEVTAYCPCARCCGKMTGKTSTKSNAWKPGVAAFPGALPYGTLVSVPGYTRAEWATVDDTGGDMRKAWKNHKKILLDIRMVYHWEAQRWGRKTLAVKVKDI